MGKTYIGLGSNVGDGPGILAKAWKHIGRTPEVYTVILSSPYRTAPVGMQSKNWFCNAVGELETSLSGIELLKVLQNIECDFGRIRAKNVTGYQDRTLDLDILLFDDTISSDPLLTLPHPEMGGRRFVLEPLSEIAPNLVHPVVGLTIVEMRDRLNEQQVGDQQKIEKAAWPQPII